MKLNRNKVSLNQCNKMVKEINKFANINNIKMKLVVHKSIIEEGKYKLLIFNLKNDSDKLPKLEGTYTLTELQTRLFEHFKTN